jgi:hypothetical protein
MRSRKMRDKIKRIEDAEARAEVAEEVVVSLAMGPRECLRRMLLMKEDHRDRSSGSLNPKTND